VAVVRLVDLKIFKRYSLAVRQEWAPAEEVLAALDEARATVRAALGRRTRAAGGSGSGSGSAGPSATR